MIYLNNSQINDWNFDNSNIAKVYRNNAVVYQKVTTGDSPTPPVPPTPSQNYLTFVAKGNGAFQFTNSVDYSLDNGSTWTTLAANTQTPTVNEGDKILWKATLTPTSGNGIGRFSSTGQFDVEGNAMSLLYGDNFVGQDDLSGKNYAFYNLFSGCTGMTSAENLALPAATLASYCYGQMFSGCTSLTTAPELPATTLADYCYLKMYNTCTSLTTAPSVLPATTLVTQCYKNMFADCTSLTTAPEIPATIVATQCCENMFIHDASLTTAPELHAATLATRCYQGIFFGCSKLNYIKCLATNISASSCTSDWVTYVSSNGTFVKAASMSSWPRNRNGIPSGWTVIDDV